VKARCAAFVLLFLSIGCSGTETATPSQAQPDKAISEQPASEGDAATLPPGESPSIDASSVDDSTAPDKDGSADVAHATDVATEDVAAPVFTPPACGETPAEPPSPAVTPPVTKYPEIKHWEAPAANVVALTFDDGPSPVTTNKILDVLAAEKIRATFFVNTRVAYDLRTNKAAQETLQRIVAAGHVLGNHTAEHRDLRLVSVDVDAQLRFVEEDVKLAAPCAPPLTLVRSPFGQPQLAGTEEERARVLPIIARHGVHVGWTIETIDYECLDAKCIVDRVNKRLDLGKRGSILFHDTQPVTAEALPLVIKEIRARGIGFVTAEKLVRDKYGKPSAALVVK
jgi:peptidoglycan-N-acetylglucosamine deacetylase